MHVEAADQIAMAAQSTSLADPVPACRFVLMAAFRTAGTGSLLLHSCRKCHVQNRSAGVLRTLESRYGRLAEAYPPHTSILDNYATSHCAAREMRTDGLLPKRTTLASSKYLSKESSRITATPSPEPGLCSDSRISCPPSFPSRIDSLHPNYCRPRI